jgi:hypothetical protein
MRPPSGFAPGLTLGNAQANSASSNACVSLIVVFHQVVENRQGFLQPGVVTHHAVISLPVRCISNSEGRGYFSLPRLDPADKVSDGFHFFLLT